MASSSPFLPTTATEMARRGWKRCDILLVSGDAYVDHPSSGIALIGRHLESLGYRVGLLPQPDWRSPHSFLALGRPRLFAGLSSGAMDSMVSHYTSMKRLRSNDDSSEGGLAGLRPDRAVLHYVNGLHRALPGLPVVIGGMEASLRRLSHYDFWSDRVRRSILLDSKATILVYGMGERAVAEIARRLEAGEDLGAIRGTALAMDRGRFDAFAWPEAVNLPSHEEVVASREAFLAMTKIVERECHPENGRVLVQGSERRVVVVFPPSLPLTTPELDGLYGLPFCLRPHPRYTKEIPSFTMIRHSLTVVRGCAGGCSFCALNLHQGRAIQSRSVESVLAEAARLMGEPGFRGTITDVGGPTANLYGLGCQSEMARAKCRRVSCLSPSLCPHFAVDQGPYLRLLTSLNRLAGVKHVFVSSGIRYDVALQDEAFLRGLIERHVSGHLKVAPEHLSDSILRLMRKPSVRVWHRFRRRFEALTAQAGKEQYLVPYLMAAFPGCGMDEMREIQRELRREGIRPQQVQTFLPTPMTMATAMYYTGLDPWTGREMVVAREPGERRRQMACLLGE